MTERPILFSGSMVRAILAGNKTQTRRVVRPQPRKVDDAFDGTWEFPGEPGHHYDDLTAAYRMRESSPYKPGDVLWVRESHWRFTGIPHEGEAPRSFLRAPGGDPHQARCYDDQPELEALRRSAIVVRVPSIHMPRWASRITLEVENVRVERLQRISEFNARAEGIERLKSGRGFYDPTVSKGMVRVGYYLSTATEAFSILWDSIYGKKPGHSWGDSPWVWAVTFKRVTP